MLDKMRRLFKMPLFAGMLLIASGSAVAAKDKDPLADFILLKSPPIELLQNDPDYFWSEFPRIINGRYISRDILAKLLVKHIREIPFKRAVDIKKTLSKIYQQDVISDVINKISIDNPNVFESIVVLRAANLNPEKFLDNYKVDELMTYINKENITQTVELWGDEAKVDKFTTELFAVKQLQVARKDFFIDTRPFLLKIYSKYNGINPILPAKMHWDLSMILRQLCKDKKCLDFSVDDISDSVKIYKETLREIGSKQLILKHKKAMLLDADELKPDGSKRFGTKTMRKALSEMTNGLINLNGVKTKDKKRVFLDSVALNPDLSLVVLDAHGSQDGKIYLSSEKVDPKTGKVVPGEKAVIITPEEIAVSIIERHDRFGQESVDDLRLVFASCFSLTDVEKLNQILIKHKVRPPVILSSSMNNQFSWSDLNNPFGSSFNRWLADYGNSSIKEFFEYYLQNPLLSSSVPTATVGYKLDNRIITVPIF